jgi:hypothetical protein
MLRILGGDSIKVCQSDVLAPILTGGQYPGCSPGLGFSGEKRRTATLRSGLPPISGLVAPLSNTRQNP